MADIRIPWQGWEEAGRLGRGGFGTVYRIVNRFTGEESAMKVISLPRDEGEIDSLRAEGYDNVSIAANYKKQLDRLLNEYKLMAQMKGHPNIVRCEDYTAAAHENGIGWDVYIRMELLKPLNQYLLEKEDKDPDPSRMVDLDEREVIRIGRDLCTALALCEQEKIVHRDIKPENIFVSRYGEFKLGDFGIARTMDHATNATHTGSYRYMAPEVYKNQVYDSRVDIYSLGLVLYWLLNRRRTPFAPTDHLPTALENEAAMNRRMAGDQVPPPICGSDALKAVVVRACAYDPADRYPTARDMLEALEKAERQIPVGTVRHADDDEGATVYGFSGETGSHTEGDQGETDNGTGTVGATHNGETGKDSGETVAVFSEGNSEGQQGDGGETVAVFSEGNSEGQQGDGGETVAVFSEGETGTKGGIGKGKNGTGKTRKPRKPRTKKKDETGKESDGGETGTKNEGKDKGKKLTPDKHLKLVENPLAHDFNAEEGSAANPYYLLLKIREASAGGSQKHYKGIDISYPAWIQKGEIYSMVDENGREVFFKCSIDSNRDYEWGGLVVIAIALVLCGFLGPVGVPLLIVGVAILLWQPLSLKSYEKKARKKREEQGNP